MKMNSTFRFFITFLIISTHLSFLKGSAQSYYALEFTENKGQWGDNFQYKIDMGNGALFITKQGFTILQHNKQDYQKLSERFHGHGHDSKASIQADGPDGIRSDLHNETLTLRSHAFRVNFLGSLANAEIVAEKPNDFYENYFIGNDPSRWKSGVRKYQVITYKNIYPNVDARYYSDDGKLKYDLVLHPGADISRIVMKYDGAEKISVKNRELNIKTSVGEAKELKPYSYQLVNGKKMQVSCDYEVTGDQVKFRVKGYDKNSVLVIDPTLIFSTYTGSSASNWGFTATPGGDGSFFAGGIVFSGGQYPVTAGAFQTSFQGGESPPIDIGITRFSPTGNQRLYSTYLGGGGNEYPHSLFADPQGNLVVLGRSTSTNYPGTNYGPVGFTDIIVTKLNATGTAIIGSLKIGGSGDDGSNIDPALSSGNCQSLIYNYGDNARSEVILDGGNNIYIAASTKSTNFPTLGAFQTANGGKQDAVVLKINPSANTVLFSSYLGGSEDDGAFVLALNPTDGNVFIAGGTASSNFPGNKAGSIQGTYQGGIDGFIAVMNNNGSALLQSTFLGTSTLDIIYGIQFDLNGFPYVMGITLGSWPVLNAAFSNAGSKQFISKLQPNLSAYVYSTVFGSANSLPNISPVAFLVDRCENVYVSGWGGRLSLCSSLCFDANTAGTGGMPVTADAIKSTTDNRDFYFFVMEKNATGQLYGSFFGQSGGEGDHVDGGTSRFDQNGAIYQAICANCGGNSICPTNPITSPFPITPGVVAPVNGSLGSGSPGECNLAAVKIAFDYQGVLAGARASINGVINDTSGCVPLTVDFTDTLAGGLRYEWNFGDGSPVVSTTTPDVNHLFNSPGLYRVTLIAIDSTKCIPRDTSYLNIRARNDQATLDLNAIKLPPCESLAYQFDNLSGFPAGKPFGANSFIWDFGDNSPRLTTGGGSVNHTYAAAGTYNVKLILIDTNYCNSPDSITRTIRLSPNVQALFETPPAGCVPHTAIFNNVSLAGQTFIWDFGDGTTFIGATPPPKVYGNAGNYIITLIANDPATCNLTDTFSLPLEVHGIPIAGFTYVPNPAQENTPTSFTNTSTGAVLYRWEFGDGDTSVLVNPVHQYKKTGDFNTCLIAINEFGCPDTICQQVPALITPLLDVPNAFTPNGDGINDKVQVRGYGIGKMTFRIYNRWGQLVFQTTDPDQGWDGRYKGALQPMDVFAYVLEVEFTDGTRATKKGDITLIR